MYKDIGQIFLINKKIIKKIIKYIKPKKKDFFLEIGCGNGILTKELYKYTKNITAIDIDNNLIKLCKKKSKLNINFINIDILNFNFNLNIEKKIRIIGNIPYYISHKIIYKFIKNYKFIKDIHILLQKQLANNLIFNKKNKKKTKTTIILNSLFKIKKIINIKNYNFKPKPKIESTLLKLTSNKNKYNIKKINLFIHIMNNIFFKKNKKIYNNIKNFINIKEFKLININPNIRINKINIKQYCKIINYIINKNLNKKIL